MSEAMNYHRSDMYQRAMALNGRPQGEKTAALVGLAEEHSGFLASHLYKVGTFAYRIGQSNKDNLTDEELANIYFGGLLHDIGKIAVPLTILYRRRQLTPEKDALLRAHGRIGQEILDDLGYDSIYGIIADEHHIGSNFDTTKEEAVKRRHPLVAYVTIADFVMSSLYPSRPDRGHYTLDEVLFGVEKRFKASYFPPELRPHFDNALEQNRILLS